jgi:2-polyprenyl-3-methyl-5-hydroxy-6-metoxy-1,4-benzoquinol methylase
VPDLSAIYDDAFFAEWGRSNRAYVNSAKVIVDVLYDNFAPRRLVDLGCGCGVYSHFFKEKGVEVVCIDAVQPPEMYAFPVKIVQQDMTVPFDNIWGDFDLALCLDVGEHIPEELSEPFLKNTTQFSDKLIMSCAPPGQGGHHHVNEQPKRYWIEKLRAHGFDYDKKRTGVLCETFKQVRTELMWMWEHISLYERRERK